MEGRDGKLRERRQQKVGEERERKHKESREAIYLFIYGFIYIYLHVQGGRVDKPTLVSKSGMGLELASLGLAGVAFAGLE